jgi:hypothetical protein
LEVDWTVTTPPWVAVMAMADLATALESYSSPSWALSGARSHSGEPGSIRPAAWASGPSGFYACSGLRTGGRAWPTDVKGGWTTTASVDCGSRRPAKGTPREALPQCAATAPCRPLLRPHWVIGGRRVPVQGLQGRGSHLQIHVGAKRRGVPSAARDSGRCGSGGLSALAPRSTPFAVALYPVPAD